MKLISESGFIRGLQCKKSLYLHYFKPELRDEISKFHQIIIDTGHNVKEYAQQLFPGGIDASQGDKSNLQRAINYTQELIKNNQQVIYGATFTDGETFSDIDILVNNNGKWTAYEVKTSVSMNDYKIMDIAFQYYVIIQSGISLEAINLIHVNYKYLKHGELNIFELFTIVPLIEKILPLQSDIQNQINGLQKTLDSSEEPIIDIGPHCTNPFNCDFIGYCWKHIPKYSVFNISRIGGKAFELYHQGILDTKKIWA